MIVFLVHHCRRSYAPNFGSSVGQMRVISVVEIKYIWKWKKGCPLQCHVRCYYGLLIKFLFLTLPFQGLCVVEMNDEMELTRVLLGCVGTRKWDVMETNEKRKENERGWARKSNFNFPQCESIALWRMAACTLPKWREEFFQFSSTWKWE